MIESLDDILSAGPDDTLGEIDGTTYGAVSLVVAHGWNGSHIWGFLSEWLSSRECAIITKNQVIEDQARQIARLTEERDAARKVVEIATREGYFKGRPDNVRGVAYQDGEVSATYDGYQWHEKPQIYQPEDLENMRRVDQSDPPRCSVTGVRMQGPWRCPCSTCTDMRAAYQSVDRLNAPASPIAFANGAALTPEQEQDLRRAVADLKQTNSHAVPLHRHVCHCEDCTAHREVLAKGGSITTKLCTCQDCEELRSFLAEYGYKDAQWAKLDGH